MEKFHAILSDRPLIRAAILFIPLAIIGLFLLPEEWSDFVVFHTAYWVGVFLPAVVIGAAVGWLTYSKEKWLLWTAIGVGSTALLLLYA